MAGVTIGMTDITTAELRDKILTERGLVKHRPHKHTVSRLCSQNYPEPVVKTTMMQLLEIKHHKPITDLLSAGSLSIVAKKLGVDASTVSKWRKKLRLQYTADNLPQCKGCPHLAHHESLCNMGICTVLYNMELYDLVPLKKEEVNNG